MVTGAPARVARARSLQEVFEILRSYPSLGDFLAFQFTVDLNYSSLTAFSEMDFVVAGPGARDGIRKCFSDTAGLSESDVIRAVAERADEEFRRLGLKFQSLWGRPAAAYRLSRIYFARSVSTPAWFIRTSRETPAVRASNRSSPPAAHPSLSGIHRSGDLRLHRSWPRPRCDRRHLDSSTWPFDRSCTHRRSTLALRIPLVARAILGEQVSAVVGLNPTLRQICLVNPGLNRSGILGPGLERGETGFDVVMKARRNRPRVVLPPAPAEMVVVV